MNEPNVSLLERKLQRAAKAMISAMAERDDAVRQLSAINVRQDRIAELAGLSKGRVSQIVKGARPVEPC